MSKQVDERVVSMQFDNAQFEKGVSTTMSTLDKFKQCLKLDGASKGLEEVQKSASSFDFSALQNGVDNVKMKFSALEVMAVTALANITNSAVNAGKRMAYALTFESINAGFQEYETQINAVQTILANTQSKGTTLDNVNAALDELNKYADMTIYNFTEMTRNIGTFTAAGVDLDTSVAAIKGIANLAAVSGSTSQQASTAMYQLSQALASGTIKLQDWNSVVNAGMGGQVFQDALKEIARVHGINIDAMIKEEGSFRETLQEGWLTSSILTETLKKFTGDLNEEQLKSMGYTEEQIKEIIKLGQTANDAATKVKTFTQLIDTLKEASQSGWTQTWEILLGDFEEAKELWTSISDVVSEMLNKSAESRNNLLQGWKDAGGRTMLIDSFKNAFEGLVSVITPVKEAFSEIFPSVTVEQLLTFTKNLKEFTEKLKISGETANKVKSIFKGVFSIFDIFRKIIIAVTKSIFDLSGSSGIKNLADMLLTAAASIGDFFTSVNESFNTDGLTGGLSKATSLISNMVDTVVNKVRDFGEILPKIGTVISNVAKTIWNAVKTVFTWITDNFTVGDIFAGLAGGGIFIAAKKFIGLVDKIKEIFENLFDKEKVGTFKEILGSLQESLQAFTAGIKIASLVAIAIAVALLTNSVEKLSKIKTTDVTKSLFAIGTMLGMLSGAFTLLTKTLKKYDSKGVTKSALAMVLMAYSIKILADAMTKIGALSLSEIAKGLTGIGASLTELSLALSFISENVEMIPLRTTIAMIALAECCKKLADALQQFATMNWSEIGRGLTAMGGALGEFTISLKVLDKVKIPLRTTISMVALALILKNLADALEQFGTMDWDDIGRGLVSMGGALGEITGVMAIISKLGGWSSIFGAAGIWITIQGLSDLADAFEQFGSMSWSEIGRGLVAMGGALIEVGGITGALGYLTNMAGILGGASIWIAIQGLDDLATAFQKFGSMSWDEIGKGLVAMGGALIEVGGIAGALGYLTNIAGILGGASIWISVQGLGDLADALKKFGEMDWDEIGRGLTAMLGALTDLAVGGLLNTLSGLGGAAIKTSVQGLGDLADALKKFGEMDWDEIGKGLVAMGGALGEIALGGLLNTLSGFGASAIAEVAEPLGTLAESVKKWVGVTVPEGLSEQLSSLASGITSFTFSGFGASAIAEVVEPLGQLADSVVKWIGVTVPEGLGTQLSALASGVKSFTFGEFGASAIAEAAAPLGQLADSVVKWIGVTVPEGLGDQLSTLATGVESFTFGGLGASAISELSEPLGQLADSIVKWTGVVVPEGLSDQLSTLATGVESFTFGGLGASVISDVAEPLGSLADSVSKWSSVTVPDTLLEDLTSLSDGIAKFSWLFIAGWSLSTITEPLSQLADAVNKMATTDTSKIDSFISAVEKIADIDVDTSSLSDLSSSISDAVDDIMKAIDETIEASKTSIGSAMETAMSGMTSAIKSSATDVKATVNSLITDFVTAIENKKSSTKAAFKSLVSDAADAIKEKRSSIKSAGKDLGEGLVEGINSKQQAVYDAAYALGQKAVQGEKDGQASNSPSKLTIKSGKWFGEGLIIGINKMVDKVYDSGYSLGETATTSLSSAISRIADIVDSDMDTQPTIRPVLDLSNVESGVGTINGLLNVGRSIGVSTNVNSIKSMMSNRQNGGNDDIISAIKGLGREIGNSSGDTYNINGVSYDDGSAVSDAIKTIVRAARVERRV